MFLTVASGKMRRFTNGQTIITFIHPHIRIESKAKVCFYSTIIYKVRDVLLGKLISNINGSSKFNQILKMKDYQNKISVSGAPCVICRFLVLKPSICYFPTMKTHS